MPTADEPLFSLRVPATADALEAVHALLHQFWHAVPRMGDADRMRFDLAVAEVAANIVEHCGSTIELTLNLRQFDDRVEADFDENGVALPPDVIEAAVEPDDPLAESGRGLVLARSALDEFAYERDGDHNHWHLVRRRHVD
jgi:serine/threonine-protein kinase RsbW